MEPNTRFPTLVGLAILLIGMTAGVFLVKNPQILKSKASQSAEPQKISQANISGTSISIYWQTNQPITGFIQAGPTTALGLTFHDDRDLQGPTEHRLHFVTLTNLTPDTTYYYKIVSGSSIYPTNSPLSFRTPASLPSLDRQPLSGTVLDTNLQPVSEALVRLKLPQAQELAAITKTGGNFTIPFTEVKSESLGENYAFPNSTISAQLTALTLENSSQVSLAIPYPSKILPPITLGKNLDLSTPIAFPTPTIDLSLYDLNGDKVVNSLDLSTVLKNFGKNPKNKKTDLNKDGVVNQKDVDLINKFIPHTSVQ